MNRPRGLCWECYYRPGVKEMYPSTSKFAKRGVGRDEDEPNGERDIAPTTAEPGTPEKIAVMAERAAKGLSIFHPGDPVIEHLPASEGKGMVFKARNAERRRHIGENQEDEYTFGNSD